MREEKGRDPFDGLRPWSAITHGAGILLTLPGAVFLLRRAATDGDIWKVVSLAIYCGSMLMLYSASTLYHALRTSVPRRVLLRKLDHISIAVLIAGTYTPLCLVPLRGSWGWSLFGVIWGLALANLFVCLFWIQAPRWVTAGIYLFMGWLSVSAIYPLFLTLGREGVFWLLLGGGFYTVGGILYAIKQPNRDHPRFGCHEIFHLFVLAGSACHFILMCYIL